MQKYTCSDKIKKFNMVQKIIPLGIICGKALELPPIIVKAKRTKAIMLMITFGMLNKNQFFVRWAKFIQKLEQKFQSLGIKLHKAHLWTKGPLTRAPRPPKFWNFVVKFLMKISNICIIVFFINFFYNFYYFRLENNFLRKFWQDNRKFYYINPCCKVGYTVLKVWHS